MNITEDMVFEKTKIAKGAYMFAQANSFSI